MLDSRETTHPICVTIIVIDRPREGERQCVSLGSVSMLGMA